MLTVNRWWADVPHERYWLLVARLEGAKDSFAVPEEDRNDVASWVGSLPAQLPARDVVFHYDPADHAIAAWSRARGPAQHKEPGWSLRGAFEKDDTPKRPSWTIKVKGRKPLSTMVGIEEIARVQWDLFPALRALEDRVGDPIYYPFAMGSPDETHPLPGRFFKLPSLFVERFPALAEVAHETRVPGIARAQRRAGSFWDGLDDFLADRPKAATRAR